jgi:hypothetical protein
LSRRPARLGSPVLLALFALPPIGLVGCDEGAPDASKPTIATPAPPGEAPKAQAPYSRQKPVLAPMPK